MDDFRRRPPMEGFRSGRLGSGRGGELSADDDIVEGHSMDRTDQTPEEQDVEGHRLVRSTEDDDVEGHRLVRSTEDDDVEGHGIGLRRATDDDDDTEGHARHIR